MAVRRYNKISVSTLPDIIAEIDAMENEPDAAKRAEMIARYRVEELRHHGVGRREIACKMINGYLLDVLWRWRGERDRQRIDRAEE